jgi:hypothetical protein
MVSFAQLLEQLEKSKSQSLPLMTSGEGGKALNVIRAGKELHDEKDTPFWDEFISLCGNSDGLSELFGVSKEKILSWPSKIQDMLDRLEQHNAESPVGKEDKEVMATGETGAIVTNQDPNNLGDMQ